MGLFSDDSDNDEENSSNDISDGEILSFKGQYQKRDLLSTEIVSGNQMEITKTGTSETPRGTFHYIFFTLNNKEYRAVLENRGDDTGIVFQVKVNDVYKNNLDVLSQDDQLSLLDTLNEIIDYTTGNNMYIFTDNLDLLKLYVDLLKQIPDIKSITYSQEQLPYNINFSLSNRFIETDKTKFKFWEI